LCVCVYCVLCWMSSLWCNKWQKLSFVCSWSVCTWEEKAISVCVWACVCVCVCVCGSVSAALPCSMTSSVDDHVTQYVIVASHRWQPASSTHLHQSAHQHWALPIPVHSTCKLLLPRRRRSRRRHNTNERASYYCANHYRALNEHTHTHTHTHTRTNSRNDRRQVSWSSQAARWRCVLQLLQPTEWPHDCSPAWHSHTDGSLYCQRCTFISPPSSNLIQCVLTDAGSPLCPHRT